MVDRQIKQNFLMKKRREDVKGRTKINEVSPDKPLEKKIGENERLSAILLYIRWNDTYSSSVGMRLLRVCSSQCTCHPLIFQVGYCSSKS